MADRNFAQFAYSLCKRRITLAAAILFTSVDDVITPVLQQWQPNVPGPGGGAYVAASSNGTGGIAGVTRNGAGDYTIALQDKYQRLLGARATFLNSKSLGEAAPAMRVVTDGTAVGVGGTPTLSGVTVSWSGNVATVSAGGASIEAGALIGQVLTDGTNWLPIVANSALTSDSGTITVQGAGDAMGETVSVYVAPTTAGGTVEVVFTVATASGAGVANPTVTGNSNAAGAAGTTNLGGITTGTPTYAAVVALPTVTQGAVTQPTIAQTPTDPAAGELVVITLELDDSTVVM